ncbi:hypothetical protein [Parasitella parasitica]|uniref:Uncharacterized protein n=1 Tax=Parasitella parasitica TaxID=35722 RepID=A0A0B7N477_9FUNG|nr:hypothetical protein [Parasitella parasitica]
MGKNDTPAMAEDDIVDFYEAGHDNSDINDAAPFDDLALEDLASDQNVYNSDGDMSNESNNDEWFSDNDSQTHSREVQAKQDKNVQVYENSRVVANLQNAFRSTLSAAPKTATNTRRKPSEKDARPRTCRKRRALSSIDANNIIRNKALRSRKSAKK